MALRDTPADLASRVAALEAYVRRTQSDLASRPVESRYRYEQRGDILVASSAAEPEPVHLPTSTPNVAGFWALTPDDSTATGVAWKFIYGLATNAERPD